MSVMTSAHAGLIARADSCRKEEMCRYRSSKRRKEVGVSRYSRMWNTDYADIAIGLRCQVDLIKGQFIDTYRGEIITDEEATAREEKAGLTAGLKASYLYSLDKHAVDDDDPNPHALKRSECYVVDGETQGGPTRFINHSCDPNVRQFTVSYNKYDERIYELAFFALKNVPAMTELTFDYQDKDEEDEEDMELDEGEEDDILGTQESATSTAPKLMECQCGSKKCRKKLWM